jgi:hypothetical protein
MSENQQQQKQGNPGKTTNIMSIFQQGTVAMRFAFYADNFGNDKLIINLIPALAEKVGGKTFDFSNRDTMATFSMNIHDVLKALEGIEKLEKEEISNFAIKHFGKNFKSMMIVGRDLEDVGTYVNILELDENYETTKDHLFDLDAKDDGEDGLLLDLDAESLEPASVIESNYNFELFKAVLNSAKRTLLKESQHQPLLQGSGGGGGSKSSSPVVNTSKRPGGRRVMSNGSKGSTTVSSVKDAQKLFEED